MDKENFDDDNEEYQYSGDQYTRAESQEASPLEKIFSKPVLMFIAVLIVGVAVFKFKDAVFLKPLVGTLESKLPEASAKNTVPAPTPENPVTVLPAKVATSNHQESVQPPTVAVDALGDKIKVLGEQNEVLYQHLSHIQQGLGVMFNDVQSIEQKLQSINNGMQAVVLELQRQKAKEIAKLEGEVRPVPVVRKAAYLVRAIIPGRAWLLRDDGATVTVVIGDRVRDYGRVKEIDVDRGLVIMSQGNVFRFKEES